MAKIPFLYDYVFANILVPNAIKPELAVVNFFHSLHSNKLRNNSLFDGTASLNDETTLTFIFGKSLGTWPTSISGSNFTNPCFSSFFTCFEDSIHFGKRNFSKYIYPIQVTPHIEQFTGFHDEGSKLNGEFFWKNMSKEALTDVRKGKSVILLDYLGENFISKNVLDGLNRAIKLGSLPKKSVILVLNNFNAEEIYNSWFPESEQYLEVRSIPFLMSHASRHFAVNFARRLDLLAFKSLRNKIRDHHFLFQNRRAREHRTSLLYNLYQEQLLDYADWSFLECPKYLAPKRIESEYGFVIKEETIHNLLKLLPKSLESEPSADTENVTGWDIHPDAYKNSYFNICTESIVRSEYKFVTEKICKPLINFQPFIFYSFPRSLQVLKDEGFKTFSPWINEDYDNETDIKLRSKMITAEVKRLCAMTKEEIHNWYWEMEEILIHNHNHLLNYHTTNRYCEDFFKYLTSRVS